MSIDKLQEKIRKLKNPTVLDFGPMQIPPYILAQEPTKAAAYGRCVKELLSGVNGLVPAIRLHMDVFAFMGQDGLAVFRDVLSFAGEQDFYVLVDLPGFASAAEADLAAETVLNGENGLPCDGVVLQPYIGMDGIRPFIQPALRKKQTVFVLARSANRSASELQDLLTGSRVVHQVVLESVKRLGECAIGRCCYNEVGAVISATSPSGIMNARASFPEVFLLMEGMDCVGGNASNCKAGFDRVGHGAAACVGASVTEAWVSAGDDGSMFVSLGVQAAERAKKNLSRYITIL